MATTRNYLDFVCTQLEGIRGVDYKRMFGEYQIYVNDKPVLLVCDNTVFVKNHPALAQLLSDAPKVIEILERVTPISKRRVQKTYGAL